MDAWLWLAVGAMSLGGGIWSMHFIGMLALILPVPVTYDLPLTVLSFLIPIVFAALGYYLSIGAASLGQDCSSAAW